MSNHTHQERHAALKELERMVFIFENLTNTDPFIKRMNPAFMEAAHEMLDAAIEYSNQQNTDGEAEFARNPAAEIGDIPEHIDESIDEFMRIFAQDITKDESQFLQMRTLLGNLVSAIATGLEKAEAEYAVLEKQAAIMKVKITQQDARVPLQEENAALEKETLRLQMNLNEQNTALLAISNEENTSPRPRR